MCLLRFKAFCSILGIIDFNRRTFGCFLYSMYKMVVAMVTQLNELRPLTEVDCYKARLCITFSTNFGMAAIDVTQKV